MPQEQPQQNSGTTTEEECEDEPKSKEEGSESEESGSSKAASASVEGGGRPQAAAASSAVAEQGEAPEASPYAEYSVDVKVMVRFPKQVLLVKARMRYHRRLACVVRNAPHLQFY